MSLRTSILLILSACTVRPIEPGNSAGEASTTGTGTTAAGVTSSGEPDDPTTGSPATASSSGGGTTTGGTATGDTTQDFIMVPDDGTSKGCDVWAQDCPEGQKCMPYSGDGDLSWESLKCVDVVPNPDKFGEPCKAIGGPLSGEDTCDEGLMCWDVDLDTGDGTCVYQCTGNSQMPSCPDPTFTCTFAADGVLTLCFPPCDPLAQDCPGGDLCIPNPMNVGSFLCVLDASGDEGQVFEGCEYANTCDPGLCCLHAGVAVECDPMSSGCCVPFCDISAANTCPGQGQDCISWYDGRPALPGLENVGVCMLPGP